MFNRRLSQQEQEPVQAGFGDVVHIREWYDDTPCLVVERERQGKFNVVLLQEDPAKPYGWPATVEANQVTKIVGHMELDEIVAVLGYVASGMQAPTEEKLLSVRDLLQAELEQ